jgi:hypothetical protein
LIETGLFEQFEQVEHKVQSQRTGASSAWHQIDGPSEATNLQKSAIWTPKKAAKDK